jgi:hypothetical protein
VATPILMNLFSSIRGEDAAPIVLEAIDLLLSSLRQVCRSVLWQGLFAAAISELIRKDILTFV